MKKILSFFFYLCYVLGFSQLSNIVPGEVLTYRIHYGILNAGTAKLMTSKTNFKGEPHLYVKGVGRTVGAVKAFFKVEDLYESYINLETGLPSYYVRNVREGNYTQHFQTTFNHNDNTLILVDKKNPSVAPRKMKSVKGMQDILSAFYYLRSQNTNQLKIGSNLGLNVWIDDEMFPFQLKVVGTTVLDTKFGKLNCLKIIPAVLSGRVFKDEEGVVMYVSNDANHIPISIVAEIAVGTLKADLDSYNNVKYPIQFK